MNYKITSLRRPSAPFIFNLDLKLTPDGTVKILEAGDGITADYKGLPRTKEAFWKFLHQLTDNALITLIINRSFYAKFAPEAQPNELESTVSMHYDGFYVDTVLFFTEHDDPAPLSQIETSQIRKKDKSVPFDPQDYTTYNSVVVAPDGLPPNLQLSQDCLVIDSQDTIKQFFLEHKAIFSMLFSKELASHRPRSIVIPKKYKPTLAAEIRALMPNVRHFVIKPVRGTAGHGITIIEEKNLDWALRQLFKIRLRSVDSGNALGRIKFTELVDYPPINPCLAYNAWEKDPSAVFLVEEFVKGTEVRKTTNFSKDRPVRYEATIRAVISIFKGAITYFGMYYKLPSLSFFEDPPCSSDICRRTISRSSHTQPVEPEIQETLKSQLNSLLPALLTSINNLSDTERQIKFFKSILMDPTSTKGQQLLALDFFTNSSQLFEHIKTDMPPQLLERYTKIKASMKENCDNIAEHRKSLAHLQDDDNPACY